MHRGADKVTRIWRTVYLIRSSSDYTRHQTILEYSPFIDLHTKSLFRHQKFSDLYDHTRVDAGATSPLQVPCIFLSICLNCGPKKGLFSLSFPIKILCGLNEYNHKAEGLGTPPFYTKSSPLHELNEHVIWSKQ